jgi:hypothetical protein
MPLPITETKVFALDEVTLRNLRKPVMELVQRNVAHFESKMDAQTEKIKGVIKKSESVLLHAIEGQAHWQDILDPVCAVFSSL